jgi:hypothetical protein
MQIKLKAIFLSICLATNMTGAHGIPDLVSVGSYSVTLRLPEGLWALEVFEKAEVIRYSYAGTANSRSEVFRLTVYRVKLPPDKVSLDGTELAKHLVQQDGLNFKNHEFGRAIHFRFKPDRIEVPAGAAYLYSSDSPVFTDPLAHYAAVALLLPKDYHTRAVAYLVVGHQIGSRRLITQEQVEYLKLVLEGLKEANKAPEPTSRSVTSRAFLRSLECSNRTDPPIAARAAPERAVAHL